MTNERGDGRPEGPHGPCEHPRSKIAAVDDSGWRVNGDTVTIWGECACGDPTLITMRIEEIVTDTRGDTAHLEAYASQKSRERASVSGGLS